MFLVWCVSSSWSPFSEGSASAHLSDHAARTGLTETWYRDVFIFFVPTWYRSTGSFDNTIIYIFNLLSSIQPYQTVLAYIQSRNSQAKSPIEPLFLDDSNKPVTRFWFQKHLKSVLQQSGIPADNYSSHSFCIRAATSAAQKGLSKHQIQALGRWSSDAFKSYIRTNRSHIKKAHQTLID